MTFAHPFMLFGLLGALIPLLVHLFDRRRPRQVPFAAISFVLKSQRRTASRLRLKRLILYTLRTLLLLAIPLALARPEWAEDQAAVSRGAAATVIAVDTALLMRWRDGASLFVEAQKQARAAIQELQPEEPAVLLGCGRAMPPPGPLHFDRAKLVSALNELKPSYEAVDLNRCLEQAAQVMTDSPLPNRRIVVISAFPQSGLRLDVPPPVSQGPKSEKIKPEIVLRDVAAGRPLANRAVVDLRAEPAPQVGPRAWQFTSTVRNFSDTEVRDVELALKVDGEVVGKGFVDVAAHGTAQKALTHQFARGGTVLVEAQLAADALTEDDVRGVVLTVPKELKALIVNGEPSTQKFRDEAFFVDAALSSTGSPVRAVLRDADAAWREDFTTYDVVLLLNVTAPPADVAAKVASFVENGGGLFVSMGDHVEPDAWNSVFSSVLPRRLRVVKTAVEPTAADAATRAARLQSVSVGHPVWAPFTGRAREGLLSTRFYRYMLFESEGGADVDVLGVMDDGAPAFLTARKGRGRVFAFASSVDRDWCDAPIRTAFLPLMQRVAGWLSGTLDEREQLKVKVGEVVTLPLEPNGGGPSSPPGAGSAPTLRDADNTDFAVMRSADGATVSAGPLPAPGKYTFSYNAGAMSFAVSLDPAASDTARSSPEELAAWFGEDVVKTAGVSGPSARTPLWTWLLALAALVFFLEGLLLRK